MEISELESAEVQIARLQDEINALRTKNEAQGNRIIELCDWADRINNVQFCHQCQHVFEAADIGGEE